MRCDSLSAKMICRSQVLIYGIDIEYYSAETTAHKSINVSL